MWANEDVSTYKMPRNRWFLIQDTGRIDVGSGTCFSMWLPCSITTCNDRRFFMINVYKKLLSYAKEKQHFLFMTVVFSVLAAFLQVSGFYYLFRLLEHIILLDEMSNVKRYALMIAGVLAGGGILYFLSLIVSHLFAFRIETNLRKYGIDGLIRASFKFFDVNSSGRIRKLIDDNAAQTHMAVAHLIPDNTGALITPVLILILGFFISLGVGMVLLVLTMVSLLLLKLMMGERQFMKTYQASLEKLSSETVEYIRGMQVVKIFGVDVKSFKALHTAIKEYAQNALNYSLSSKRPYVLFQEMFFAIVALLIPFILLFADLGSNARRLSLELIMVFFPKRGSVYLHNESNVSLHVCVSSTGCSFKTRKTLRRDAGGCSPVWGQDRVQALRDRI